MESKGVFFQFEIKMNVSALSAPLKYRCYGSTTIIHLKKKNSVRLSTSELRV